MKMSLSDIRSGTDLLVLPWIFYINIHMSVLKLSHGMLIFNL